jgi:hypothetical protein
LIGHVIGDSVLYHSPHWIAHFDALICVSCEICGYQIRVLG